MKLQKNCNVDILYNYSRAGKSRLSQGSLMNVATILDFGFQVQYDRRSSSRYSIPWK